MPRVRCLAPVVVLTGVLALASAPAVVEAQPRLMAGVGVSTPLGDLADVAGVGWHAGAGIQLEFPTFPVSLRADGAFHSFGEESPDPQSKILAGALSAVVDLPGPGIIPYFLGGIGMYRTTQEGIEGHASDSGFHGAFGVNLGDLGFGGYGEVRYVNVNAEGGDARFVTATIGFRL